MSPFIFMDKRNFLNGVSLLASRFIPAAFIPAAFCVTLQLQYATTQYAIMYKVQCTHLFFICVSYLEPILFHPRMGCIPSNAYNFTLFIMKSLFGRRHERDFFCIGQQKHTKHSCSIFSFGSV